MFENRVHRKVLKPKRDEVTRALRRPYNKEPYDLSSSPNIIWMIKWTRMRWVGHVAYKGETRGEYRVLVVKRALGRPRHR